MPIRPGILLSSLLMVACLGMNMTLYPEVHEMLREPKDTVASASQQKSVELEKSEKPFYPELDKPQTQIQTEVKSSKVNRPIPIETQTSTVKKSEGEKLKKENPVEKIEENKKPETPPPPIEEKKPEPKPVEAKIEPKTEPKKEEKPKIADESYGLPSVFPLDTSEPMPEPKKPEPPVEPPKKKGADAFLPLVPTELEKEYRELEGKNVNQAEFPRTSQLPQLKRQPIAPERTAPLYAAPFSPETSEEPERKLKRLPETETITVPKPSKPAESKPATRKPPKAVWDTPETIMERPIVYE